MEDFALPDPDKAAQRLTVEAFSAGLRTVAYRLDQDPDLFATERLDLELKRDHKDYSAFLQVVRDHIKDDRFDGERLDGTLFLHVYDDHITFDEAVVRLDVRDRWSYQSVKYPVRIEHSWTVDTDTQCERVPNYWFERSVTVEGSDERETTGIYCHFTKRMYDTIVTSLELDIAAFRQSLGLTDQSDPNIVISDNRTDVDPDKVDRKLETAREAAATKMGVAPEDVPILDG